MKKKYLVLLTLVPLLAGWIICISAEYPRVWMALYYILPVFVSLFWFWLGSQFSKTDQGYLKSLLISSVTGLLSLGIYVWQFCGKTDETRSMLWAGVSQYYSCSAPLYLLARIVLLFETQPNYIGGSSGLALQIIAVLYMAVIFSLGYMWGKRTISDNS